MYMTKDTLVHPLAIQIGFDERDHNRGSNMSEVVKPAILQTAWTGDKESMIELHEKYLTEAAAAGTQVMCFQELFYGPYFCQVQDAKFYSYAEAIPDGPTTKRFQELAAQYGIVLVLPMYEEEQPGVLYNTAAVIDADGTYLGKYRKVHIPQVNGFWEKFYFRPGNLGYPVFETAVGQGRCQHLLRPALPRGLAGARAQRRPDRLQPVGDQPRPLGLSVEARTDGIGRRQHVLRRCDQPRRHRAARRQRLLRHVLLRQPAWPVRRRNGLRPGRRAGRPRSRPRP